MTDTEIIDLLIEGGNAKPGPASASRLGMFKVNIGKLFQDINEKTKDYKGMNVPVKVMVNKKDGSYSIKIGTPPVSSLVRKELGLKKIAPKKEEEDEKEEEGAEEKTEEKKEEEKKKTKKELKREKAEKARKEKEKEKERIIVGNLTMEQCVKITRMKRNSLLSKNTKNAVKEVVASCVSMPITVEEKSPKEVLKEIDEGKYDEILKDESS